MVFRIRKEVAFPPPLSPSSSHLTTASAADRCSPAVCVRVEAANEAEKPPPRPLAIGPDVLPFGLFLYLHPPFCIKL